MSGTERPDRAPGCGKRRRVGRLLASGLFLSAMALLVFGGCSQPPAAGATDEPADRPVAPPRDDHGDSRDSASDIGSGEPLSGRLERAGDVDYFRVEVEPASVRIVAATDQAMSSLPVVTIEDVAAGPNTSGAVAWADLPAPRPRHIHIKVTGDRGLRYRLSVWLVPANEPGVGDRFDIVLQYPAAAQPTREQRDELQQAAAFWEGVITAGLPDLPGVTSAWKCRDGDRSLFGQYVDDLVLYVRVEPVVGAPAESSICRRRAEADGGLPLLGSITFDPDDLERLEESGFLRRAAMRQIAYVLGFGLLWDEEQFGLLQEPALGPNGAQAGRDTHFSGTAAAVEFAAAGGTGYGGAGVPVENDSARYGSGVLDVHWRESVFGAELMSTVLETAAPPVSRVTLASLADLGYAVDYARAEPYTVPAGATGAVPGGGEQFGGRAVRGAGDPAAALPDGLVRALNSY